VLVLSGAPGYGKTELAGALFGGGYYQVDSADACRSVHFLKGDRAVFDECKVDLMPPDEAKKLLDLAHARQIRVRHTNITIPKGVPRIFTCNCENLAGFFPPGLSAYDLGALERRVLFVKVEGRLFAKTEEDTLGWVVLCLCCLRWRWWAGKWGGMGERGRSVFAKGNSGVRHPQGFRLRQAWSAPLASAARSAGSCL